MMHINVNIKNTIVILQQFKNSKHNVIHITKTTCFLLFGVMETTTPVYGNISAAMIEFNSCIDASPCRNLREFEHAVEARTIVLTNFEVC